MDVTEEDAYKTIAGAHLVTTSVTDKIYSSEYPVIEISLDLAQNMLTTMSLNSECAIGKAEFTDTKLNELFELRVIDDKTLELIPKVDLNNAAVVKEIKNSYKSQVTVYSEGDAFVTNEKVTIKIDKKLPNVKASAIKLNGFYTEDEKLF